jgi:2,4-dienoyl-CoA reductase-like NADH-dependent reductase (Old Yellow Enzyme family)
VKYPSPGRFKSREEFETHLASLDPRFACVAEPGGAEGALAQSIEAHGRRLANRFAVHPMEGWDGTTEGLPTPHTMRRWHRFGASGAALIWGGEAFAVQRDGRANPGQLFLNPDAPVEAGLRDLLATLHDGHASTGAAERPFVGLQLTHSGRFARPDDGGPRPRIAHHHPVLADKFALAADTPLVTDAELEAIGERFVEAAVLARAVGFDFVDVKCCHGYLLHEMLGAHTRPGPYGGSFENRTRLFRRIVDAIRDACPDLHIGVRVSITDVHPYSTGPDGNVGTPHGGAPCVPYRYGFGVDEQHPLGADLTEPFRFLALLESLDIRLVNVTIGSPYYCPHLQRPAAYPPSDGYQPPEDPLLGVIRHLEAVRACKEAFPDLLFVGSGYTYLQEYLPHVAAAEVGGGHVDFVGLGRMTLSYPELPRDVIAGAPLAHRSICRTFSDCTTAPRHGLVSGCYPLDPHYRGLPQAVELKTIKKARRADA